jgi:hypothetical protein
MKDINLINDKNQIDLNSLSNFLLDKEDDLLNILFQIKEYKEIDINNDNFINHCSDNRHQIPQNFWFNRKFRYKVVSKNGLALGKVPKNLKDYSLCELAVSSPYDSNYGNPIESVPRELRDYNIYEKAVSNKGRTLYFVPRELRDYNLCEKAVSNDGGALQYVPFNLIDYPICYKGVSQNGWSLAYVPQELKDYNIIKKAFQQRNNFDIVSFYWFPKEYIPQLIKDFPQDKKFLEKYLRKEWLLKEYISKEVKKLLKEYYLKEK